MRLKKRKLLVVSILVTARRREFWANLVCRGATVCRPRVPGLTSTQG
jgi:hypothetical protein